jgi:alkylation response protein AidB-like acyl-CoA dehydrogenase
VGVVAVTAETAGPCDVDLSATLQESPRITKLLQDVRDLVPPMSVRAQILDCEGRFPAIDFDLLRDIGALSSFIPQRFGGPGLGVDPGGASELFALLRLIGQGNLAVGRIFEGHANAIKLIHTFGSEAQIERASADLRAGHLFAIWNAETQAGIRILDENKLSGSKAFCSGAGHVTRALLTAKDRCGTRMLLIPLEPGERVGSTAVALHGMRATQTASVQFDGLVVSTHDFIGTTDDYTREPTFSAGAWRTSAVTLGGLDSLVAEMQQQLRARNRHEDPHQLARMGNALIARETARLWIERAARMEESIGSSPATITGYVNLARVAVESAALEIIRLVQRSLGLSAFLQTNPVERLMRDLAIYLRQPATDEALTEAAAWFLERDFPEDDS